MMALFDERDVNQGMEILTVICIISLIFLKNSMSLEKIINIKLDAKRAEFLIARGG